MFKTVLKNSRGLFGCVISRMATGVTNPTDLEGLNFDNLALRSLPIDPQTENYPRQVPGACFSRVSPTPLENPQLVAISRSALELLGIDADRVAGDANFVQYLSGNKDIPGSEPAAHCYCGHQFGSFAGQLGDGATMYLGEIVNSKGERWELQFKGAGLTPYSRTADGRKVLRSSIREFLCSEAMHNLGIPTTRAGTCITSDSRVVRDIFYDGNPTRERCTVITRIAPTFLRFGSFEIFKGPDSQTGRTGPSHGRKDILNSMLDYTISTFYADIEKSNASRSKKIMAFFTEVVKRTAKLVALWQCVGFCHGVLNTDNMSIIGLTIDYGPYGFMDRYDPDFICNASDDGGRYTYAKQPEICKWNLQKLAEALQEVASLSEMKEIIENVYGPTFDKEYQTKMAKKFGFLNGHIQPELISSFLETMHKTGSDFTNSFLILHHLPYPSSEDFEKMKKLSLEKLLAQCCTVEELKRSLRPTMDPRQFQMLVMMAQSQPMFLSMMGMDGKLKAELDRREKFENLKNVTAEIKRENDLELWENWMKSYQEALKHEESKISVKKTQANAERLALMNSVNPRFILRNWVAQNAISKAEKGDYNEVKNVVQLLEHPFKEQDLQEFVPSAPISDEYPTVKVHGSKSTKEVYKSCSGISYDTLPPDWAQDIKVT